MKELNRAERVWVAMDLAKNVLQVHVEDEAGRVRTSKALRRERVLGWCQSSLPVGTVIAMEACAEFGVTFPQDPEELRRRIADELEDASNELTTLARQALQRAHEHWLHIEAQLAWCDERIAVHAREDERARAISRIPGIGPVTASALVATVEDFGQFRSAAQFGAWLGMTPSQDSSGGKTRLGRITKRGDVYLRTLLIQAEKSAVMTAHRRGDPVSQWAARLKERVGWQKACVALGHKHAHIVWAMLVRGRPFDATHLSSFPAPPGAAAAMTAATAA